MSALVRNDCPPIEIVGAGMIVFVCSIEYWSKLISIKMLEVCEMGD